MKDLTALSRIYTRTIYHHFVPVRWKNYFPFFSLLALGFALLYLEFLGFNRVFRYVSSLQELPLFFIQALMERFVGLIFLICYSMIFMSSMINGLSTFFISHNLPFLYALPVAKRKILFVKFIENWLISCYLIVSFLVVFLLAYARSFHLGWLHYFGSLAVLVLFTLSAVALGSAMLTILIRFFPVRRIHQVVTMIAVIFLAALTIAVRMMKPERLLNPADSDDFVRLLKDLTVPSLNHLPSSWSANVVIYGRIAPLAMLLLFTAAALAILAVNLWLFYDRAFVFSQESRSLRNKRRVAARRNEKRRSAFAALIVKDTTLFFRDATQWSQLLLLAALVLVYLLNIKNLSVQLPMVRWIVSFINLGLAGFVLAALSVRFLFPSVSIEGRSFWILKTFPVSFRKLLWCKYLIFFPPFLLFTQLLVYFSNRILQVPSFFVALSMMNILAVAFSLTGLAIGIGSLMPNFKSDHPSQIAVGPGGVLYMLLSFVYLAVMLLIQMKPVWYYVIGLPESVHSVRYFSLAIVLTLVVGLVPMEWGARHLAKQEY